MTDAAIVLAGGGSRRMGRDKAWLELDGRPLLVWVVERLATRCSPIVISARPGQSLPDFGAIAVVRIDDPIADAGPLVGVELALAWLEAHGSTRAYVSSCDAAGLSDAHVERMLAAVQGPAIAAVPVEPDGRRHPLAAALAVAPMRAKAAAQLAAGDARLQALLTGPDIVEIPIAELPDPAVFEPCNTAQEWAQRLTRPASRS